MSAMLLLCCCLPEADPCIPDPDCSARVVAATGVRFSRESFAWLYEYRWRYDFEPFDATLLEILESIDCLDVPGGCGGPIPGVPTTWFGFETAPAPQWRGWIYVPTTTLPLVSVDEIGGSYLRELPDGSFEQTEVCTKRLRFEGTVLGWGNSIQGGFACNDDDGSDTPDATSVFVVVEYEVPLYVDDAAFASGPGWLHAIGDGWSFWIMDGENSTAPPIESRTNLRLLQSDINLNPFEPTLDVPDLMCRGVRSGYVGDDEWTPAGPNDNLDQSVSLLCRDDAGDPVDCATGDPVPGDGTFYRSNQIQGAPAPMLVESVGASELVQNLDSGFFRLLEDTPQGDEYDEGGGRWCFRDSLEMELV